LSANEESDPPQGEAGAERADFQEETRAHRLGKLDRLRERGVEPYPVRFDRDSTAAALHEEFGDLAAGSDTGKVVRLAGRVMGERRHGGLDFAELRDETGTIQLLIARDAVGVEALHDFSDLDLGDWIGVEGTVIVSDHGELSVRLASFELLSKSLRALPDIRHGIADPETRYRQRYLDAQGFLEVETPILQPLYGGAAARPFVTHHNALDMPLYLRIADELYLKRLLVGGFERVYEIGHDFRNEGIDRTHNPEFTMLEFYEAYADYQDLIRLTEELISSLAQQLLGTTVIEYQGHTINLAPPWRRGLGAATR